MQLVDQSDDTRNDNERSNGYEAVAAEFSRLRGASNIGVATVRKWARSIRPGGAILDLGCGSGAPIAAALVDDGFLVDGIDASPTLAAEFRRRLPTCRIACEALEESRFFNRQFDGILAVGVMFLLTPESQRSVISAVGRTLNLGGRLLVSAPARECTWIDILTGRSSRSLGKEEYESIFSSAGLTLIAEDDDEGGNHYFCAVRSDD